MEVREISTQEFHTFSLKSDCANFYQSVPFTAMKEREGWKSFYLGGFENDQLVAATIVLTNPMFGKYQYCIAVKGFLMDYQNEAQVKAFSAGVKRFLKARNGIYLRINPSFFYKERDADGDVVVNGYDHTSWKDHVVKAGFTYEGEKRGLDMNEHVRWIYVLPLLHKSIDDIRNGMSKLTWRNIKNTEKYHVEVKEITDKKDLDIFLNIMKATGERRNFEIFEQSYYEDLFDFFMPDNKIRFLYAEWNIKKYSDDLRRQLHNIEKKVHQHLNNLAVKGENERTRNKLIAAQKEQELTEKKIAEVETIRRKAGDCFPIACANFMLYQNEVVYFHGGSYAEYMHCCAQFAIQWNMIQYALDHGYTRFNFLGISGIFDKTAPDYGVFQFKKGFGGHVEEYVGYFHCKLSLIYDLYRILRKCKGMIKRLT